MNKYINLDAIRFDNFSNEVKLVGTVHQDNFNFQSEIRVDNSMINAILNFIQRNNPEEDICSRLETEILPEDEIHYQLKLVGLFRQLPMDVLLRSEKYRQIRA